MIVVIRRLAEHRLLRLGLFCAIAPVAIFAITAALIAVDGLTDSAAASDVVVVLGNEVLTDGTPSDRLAARLDAALKIHESGLADHVIVSGGVGKSGHSEADVMAAYLIEAGVEADQIVLDPNGFNTRATAINTAEVMDEQGWSSAIVATQFFHIPRTELAFNQAGISPVTTARANYFERRDGFGLAREVPAYFRYWLIDDVVQAPSD